MIDPQLAALMVQTCYAYAPSGTDAYGHTGYSATPLTLPCHIVGRVQEIVAKTGEAAVSTGYALLADVYPGLADDWLLNVPDPSAPGGRRNVNIIAVITRYDEAGASHQQVYYGPRGGQGRSAGA